MPFHAGRHKRHRTADLPSQLCKVEPQLCKAMEKECPQCTRKFKPGRIDQVYCNNLCRQRAYLERKEMGLQAVQPANLLPASIKPGIKSGSFGVKSQTAIHYLSTKSSADIDDEYYERNIKEEKEELRELIKGWDAAAADAIKNRSMAVLTELQDQMKRELGSIMYYEPEHNELLCPIYGVAYALELAIEQFYTSQQNEGRKWYDLEDAFSQAKKGCGNLF
jgi:hypothetical protein